MVRLNERNTKLYVLVKGLCARMGHVLTSLPDCNVIGVDVVVREDQHREVEGTGEVILEAVLSPRLLFGLGIPSILVDGHDTLLGFGAKPQVPRL